MWKGDAERLEQVIERINKLPLGLINKLSPFFDSQDS